MAGLTFEEEMLSNDDPSARAELLLMSPSFLVPCLRHNGLKVWDTLALGEYLNETYPKAGLLPHAAAAKVHCRAISGEMHSGFTNLRLGAADESLKGALSRLQDLGWRTGRY